MKLPHDQDQKIVRTSTLQGSMCHAFSGYNIVCIGSAVRASTAMYSAQVVCNDGTGTHQAPFYIISIAICSLQQKLNLAVCKSCASAPLHFDTNPGIDKVCFDLHNTARKPRLCETKELVGKNLDMQMQRISPMELHRISDPVCESC